MKWPSATDRMTADALDWYWDTLNGAHPGGPAQPDELLDPALVRSVRRVQLIDETPRPEPAFATRLRTDLLASGSAPMAETPPVIAGPAAVRGVNALPRSRFLVELAVAAALLLVVLGGGSGMGLPAILAPVSPTASASAVEPGATASVPSLSCRQTATPAPFQALAATNTSPAPTSQPSPTVRPGDTEAC